MNLIFSILKAVLRRPETTEAIVSALTKTVIKLESHADKKHAKVDADLAKASALVDNAMTLKDEANKARAIASNIGALLK
jgi:hypothetical protein